MRPYATKQASLLHHQVCWRSTLPPVCRDAKERPLPPPAPPAIPTPTPDPLADGSLSVGVNATLARPEIAGISSSILVYMCPHTAVYTGVYVSSYCCICCYGCVRVLLYILLYMCPHTAINASVYVSAHTAINTAMDVSSYCYTYFCICVRILL